MAYKVIVALAEGFEEIEAVTPTDILRRAGYDVLTVGLSGRVVTGSHGISLTADAVWADVAHNVPDLLLLPGGMPGSKNLSMHLGLKAMADHVFLARNRFAAICAAPAYTLGSWGLLSGRRATCYPGCENLFPPDVAYQKDATVVVDGNFITACGPGVATEFALAIVQHMSGLDLREKLQMQMQYNEF